MTCETLPRRFAMNETAERGRAGEVRLAQWLERRPRVARVELRTDDLEAQRAGWDLAVWRHGDVEPLRIEVKTDSHRPERLFLETAANESKGTPGCLMTSQADWWCYVFHQHGTMVAFDPAQARERVPDWSNHCRSARAGTGRQRTLYTTRGMLVPRKTVLDQVPGAFTLRDPGLVFPTRTTPARRALA